MDSDSPDRADKRPGPDGAGVLLPESTASGPVDFAAVFGNRRPVEVEIGSGKGTFILARAQARPEVNLLGIEWARPYCLHAADRLRRHGVSNVRMLRTDAGPFFRDCLPAGSIIRLHIYFPDPWPKRRHHARRLVQPPFVDQAHRVLTTGGLLLVVTDHMDYFAHIQDVFARCRGWARIEFPQMADRAGEVVGTNFERKYIAEGRRFYKVARMKY
jgi:tRNA (guanine-N7-)-methyltransferase